MGTAFDPDTHSIITDANGNPVPQKYDPEANSGAGGFVVLNADNDKVTLNGRNVSYPNYYNGDTTLNVSAGDRTNITVQPPVGELWRIQSIYIEIPGISGASGEHSIRIRSGGNGTGTYEDRALVTQSDPTSPIQIDFNEADVGTGRPSDSAEFREVIKSLIATNTTPLHIRYYNDTNSSTQDGSVLFKVNREVEYIVE